MDENYNLSKYNDNFKNYYNRVKFAEPKDQQGLIIEFFKYLLKGYDQKFINIADVGAWVTTAWLNLHCGEYNAPGFVYKLNLLGKKGDDFDIGEKRIKEDWKMSYENAEKWFIQTLRDFIREYSSPFPVRQNLIESDITYSKGARKAL